ncbi:MAG: class I SAM-dependent methyltransferase [Candidatus Bathyarchaeales archaeon]
MCAINWEEMWRIMLLDTYRTEIYKTSYWDKHANEFNENMVYMGDLTKSQLDKLPLLPEYTVLDVGAGPGRLTIPVAKRVKQVIALEPSKNMLELLKANARKESIKNIHYINSSLEDLHDYDYNSLCDVVIASFSLFMVDIKKALVKIDSLAKKGVYLFLSASKWMADELQKIIYGETVFIWPDYIYIYNILHNLGIFANVEVWSYDSTKSYQSIDDAVSNFMELYHIPAKKEGKLREYLDRILVENKGKLWLSRKMKVAMIWWTKTE